MTQALTQAIRASITGGENALLAMRPYIATHGRHRGQPVIAVNTGGLDESGNPVYSERPLQTNANGTLRKDEWVLLEDQIIEATRERLVIVGDLQAAGLTYNVGGLGTILSEWETGSEITDAKITMDGESSGEKDAQEFGLNGVPIPIIHKEFSIGTRMLEASRTRGAALDVTTGTEAGRSVARRSEQLVFFGSSLSAKDSAGNQFAIPGLLTFSGRATYTIANWAVASGETILANILAMISLAETQERAFGPFNLYVPGAYAGRLREDFKANSDKTLMQRILGIPEIKAVRISDVLTTGNVVLVQMSRGTIDLAVASDVTTVQWQSGSGWTNHFQTFAAWAPRIKQDFDGHCGVVHGSV